VPAWPAERRAGPPLPVARLRAEGKIVEIGPDDLSFTPEEASSLLRNAGVALDQDQVAELYRRTEGWPAGLSLAVLDLRDGGAVAGAAVCIGRVDTRVSGYVESELLLVPLDRRGEWYRFRFHHLFRDILLAGLRRQQPELVPVLRRRAADWCWRNGLPDEAVGYLVAAGDAGAVAGMVERLGAPAYRQGRLPALRRWFDWLEDRGGIEGHPMAAVLDALLSAMTGRPADAERWASAAGHCQNGDVTRPGDPAALAWAALLRAMLCRRGVRPVRRPPRLSGYSRC